MQQNTEVQKTPTNGTISDQAGASDQQAPIKPHHIGQIPQWTVSLGILLTGVLYLFLPDRITVGPNWLLLALELCVLTPFWIIHFSGRTLPYKVVHSINIVLLSIITLVLSIGVITLIELLPSITAGGVLLRAAGLFWFSNVAIFGLWYWNVDGGGSRKRHEAGHVPMDFVFPQQTLDTKPGTGEPWAPQFMDYFFLAFTAATAFSPTDTYPLTHRAKLLMIIEAMISLMIVGIVIGRVANIL
jgi:hypothetical protein